MAKLYNCEKSSILIHCKNINFDCNSVQQYKLTKQDKQKIISEYNIKTSNQLASEYNVSRGMITKTWYDAKLQGKERDILNFGNDLIGMTFGYLTVIDYSNKRSTNGNKYWVCKCNCQQDNCLHIKVVNGNSLLSGRTRSCGVLSKQVLRQSKNAADSLGNIKIANILNQNQITYEREKRFDSCRDKLPLLFDFYVDNKYCIEYDGKHHFPNTNSIFNYELTHKHDIIKTKWCKDNNIPLIRIPYTKYKMLCLEDLLLETSEFIEK